MATAHGSTASIHIKAQSDAETVATGAFAKVPVFSFDLSAMQPLTEEPLLSAGIGRDGGDPDQGELTVDGSAVVPLDLTNSGHWFNGIFGAAVATGTTDRTYTWTSGKLALPSYSMEKAFPEVPSYPMYLGVQMGGFSFDMGTSGSARMTVPLMGLSEIPSDTSGAGTPTMAPTLKFMQASGSITRNESPLAKVVGGSVRFDNGLTPVRTIRADQRVEEMDPGNTSCGGDLRIRYTDDTLTTAAIISTPCALTYGFSISATKSLLFTMPRVFFSRPRVPITGPAGIELPISFVAAADPMLGYRLKVELKNQMTAY